MAFAWSSRAVSTASPSAVTWSSGAGMATVPVFAYSTHNVCLTGNPGLTAPGVTRLVVSVAVPPSVTSKAFGSSAVRPFRVTRTE